MTVDDLAVWVNMDSIDVEAFNADTDVNADA